MSDIDNKLDGGYTNGLNGNAVPLESNREERRERLKEAEALLKKTDKSTQTRIAEIEKLAKQSELDMERRVSDAKAKMTENAERAKKNADEQAAILEYTSEYRQRIAARVNKKAELLRQKNEEAELLAERQTAEKRREEIEDFLIRERQELDARNEKASAILLSLTKRMEENASEEEKESVVEEQAYQQTDSDASSELDLSENEKSFDAQEVEERPDTEKSESEVNRDYKPDERIILNIGNTAVSGSSTLSAEDDGNIIHIKPQSVVGVYAPPCAESISNAGNTYFDYRASEQSAATKYQRTDEYDRVREAMEFDIRMRDEAFISEYEKYQSKRFSSNTESSLGDYIDIREQYPDPAYQNDVSDLGQDYSENLDFDRRKDLDDRLAERYEREDELRDAARIGSTPENEEILAANDYFDSVKEYTESRHAEAIDVFARSQLSKTLEKFYKDESVLLRRLDKLASRQRMANPEENITLIVEKIAVQKELCELAIEALGACVHVKAKSKSTKHKRILEGHIAKYNSLCDEYEAATGRTLERIEYDVIDDVLAGKICRPIPNVRYYGNEDEFGHNAMTAESDRARRYEEEAELVRREYDRYVAEGPYTEDTRADRRASQKRQAERMSAIRRATERDMLLIGLRNEYRIASLEARRDILMNSYGSDRRRVAKEIKSINRKISKVKHADKSSARLEREDNSRYYLLPALPLSEEKTKKGARRERLESLRLRLDVLLAERESINERLIALYGGSDKKLRHVKIKRKAGGVRRKSAKAMHKKQSDIARKIESYRAPLDMKERAYELLNKKIACAATADENQYKLKRMRVKGRARAELIAEIKRSRRDMKRADTELRYMLKKLKRQEERYKDDREWALLLIVLALLSALGIGAWMLWGDRIIAYFNYLIEWFRK